MTLLTIFAAYTGTGIAVSGFLMVRGYLSSMLIGAGAGVCAAVAMVVV